ncbi:MAG: SPOR domain-containing protein [Bacteroidales bacterium]|nr:SPOR domain-containing protein [Bacteroidales bacterium]
MKKFLILLVISVFSAIYIKSYSQNQINFDKVFCYRQIEKQDNVLTVTLLINTKGLEREKTLKIKEKFPTGFKCKVIEPYGSTNAVTETTLLFVWSALPENDLFIVKYQLTSAAALNESVNIIGNVSFLSETGIKYVSVEQRDFLNDKEIQAKIKALPPYKPGANVTQPASANITIADVPKTTETKPAAETQPAPAPKPVPRTNVKDEPVKTEQPKPQAQPQPTAVVTEPKTEPKVERVVLTEDKPEATPEPIKTETKQKMPETKPVENKPIEQKQVTKTTTVSSGFYYTVQIGASPKKLPAGFYDKYSLKHSVDELFIDNMYKYSTGKFATLKEANQYLNEVKQKGLQCFVVAYNNGNKITIKEALQISGQ